MADFINARAGDVAAYDRYCEEANPEIECQQCGDHHSPTRCPWAETCAECDRDDVTMAEPRLCADCSDELERAAARHARLDAYESKGDYLRDMQKGER